MDDEPLPETTSWTHDRTADVELTITAPGGELSLRLSLTRATADDVDDRVDELARAARQLTHRLIR